MKNEETPNQFPLAMDAPEGKVNLIDQALIGRAVEMSRKSPRRRIIYPFHKTNEDVLHRMLNCLQPDSYIRPHRHLSPPKAESVIVLKGSICFIVFDSDGRVQEHTVLSAMSDRIGVDMEPGVFHTFFAVEDDTVLFEIKPGPYEKGSDKDFAPWAPAENSEGAEEYLRGLQRLAE